MTSQKTFWIVFVIVLVVGGIYFFRSAGRQPETVNPVFTTNTSGTPAFTLDMKNISENDPNGKYQITAQYPFVSGLANAAANDLINKTVLDFVVSEINTFKEDNEGNVYAVNQNDEGQSTLTIVTATSTPRTIPLISFTVAEEFYSAGAAHPGGVISAFNFDSTTGKKLALTDFFSGDYLKVLSDYSKIALKKQLGNNASEDQINDGAAPTADNFAVLVPQDNGVHVVFNEYQVAAYAAGAQEVVIPYSALKSVINPTGPLKGLK